MCRGITTGSDFADLDVALGKKSRQVMYDSRLVQAHDIDGVGEQFLAEFLWLGALELDGEIVRLADIYEAEAIQIVSRWMEEHGDKLKAE